MCPCSFHEELSSYKDPHQGNTLNKHLKVGMWTCRWKPGSRKVLGNRFQVAPYSCYKSKSEGTEIVLVAHSIYHQAPIKPWLCTKLHEKGWQGERWVPVILLREKVDDEWVFLFPLLWGPPQLNVKGIRVWFCFSAFFSVPGSICQSLCQHHPMSETIAPQ